LESWHCANKNEERRAKAVVNIKFFMAKKGFKNWKISELVLRDLDS
jgi:hypothetical protein